MSPTYVVSVLMYLERFCHTYLNMLFCNIYYNAFICSCFSYCAVFWFNNNCSGKYKLTNKVDNIILVLAKKFKQTLQEFICDIHIYDACKVYKLQAMLHMTLYDIYYNPYNFAFVNLISNNSVPIVILHVPMPMFMLMLFQHSAVVILFIIVH